MIWAAVILYALAASHFRLLEDSEFKQDSPRHERIKGNATLALLWPMTAGPMLVAAVWWHVSTWWEDRRGG